MYVITVQDEEDVNELDVGLFSEIPSVSELFEEMPMMEMYDKEWFRKKWWMRFSLEIEKVKNKKAQLHLSIGTHRICVSIFPGVTDGTGQDKKVAG